MKQLALALMVAGLMLVATSLFVGRGKTSAGEQRFPPVGVEEPVPGTVFSNGYNVPDIGFCRFGETYQREALLLGEPVSGFSGKSQAFVRGKLECHPENPPGAQVLWADLGRLQLGSEGRTPLPGSELPPVVQAYLSTFVEQRLDIGRYFGQALTGSLCRAGQCRVVFDKAEVRFAEADAASRAPDRVTASPLGCQFTPTCAAALAQSEASTHRQPPVALVAAGIALALFGGVLFVASTRRRSSAHFTA